MQLNVLGCQGGSTPARHLPGLLLEGTVLLEAGSVTSTLSLAEQLEIRHVLLSHAHLDHTGGLAHLADNRCCLNDPIWPDFSAIPTVRDPIVRLQTLEPGVPQPVGDHLTILPVPAHHTVPAVGFIVHDDAGALIFSGDTGPTEQLWALARAIGNVRAIEVMRKQ